MQTSLPKTAAAMLLVAAVFSCRMPFGSRFVTPEPGERHLANIRQLTFGGENAEAYFSADGKRLIFQSKRDGRGCDQEFVMNADGSNVRRVSNGFGKTTCGYFYGG